MAGPTHAEELTRHVRYDPELDAALRYPHWVVGQVPLGWGLHEVLSLRDRVILLERSDSPAVRRCSLAHALAHLDLGHRVVSGFLDARQELQAGDLAARRLIGLDELLEALSWTADSAELAAELVVDASTLSMRWSRLTPAERACVEARVLAAAA